MSLYPHFTFILFSLVLFVSTSSEAAFDCGQMAPQGYNQLVAFKVKGRYQYACMNPATERQSDEGPYVSVYQISPSTNKIVGRLSVYTDILKVVTKDKYRMPSNDLGLDDEDEPAANITADKKSKAEPEESKPGVESEPNHSGATYYVSYSDLAQLENSFESNCSRKKRFTTDCCSDTEQCLRSTNYDNEEAGLLTSIGKTYLSFQQMAQVTQRTMASAGISRGCESLKKLNQMGAVINTSLVQLCNNSRSKCQSTCGEVVQKARGLLQNLGISTLSSDRYACKNLKANTQDKTAEVQTVCEGAMNVYSQATTAANYCGSGTAGKAMKMASQNLVYGAMADQFQQCEQGLQSGDNAEVTATTLTEGGGGDCTSLANASSPICIKCNADPKAAGCENVRTSSFKNNSGYTTAEINAMNGEPITQLPEWIEPGTEPDRYENINDSDYELGSMQNIEAKNAGTTPIKSGRAGGPTLGGGMGGFNSNSTWGKSGNSQEEGYNTDIMHGERSGGGYTTANVSTSSSGGFSGYGRSGLKGADDEVTRELASMNRLNNKIKKAYKKEFKARRRGFNGVLLKTAQVLGMNKVVASARRKLGIKAKHPNPYGHPIFLSTDDYVEANKVEHVSMQATLVLLFVVGFAVLLYLKKRNVI